MEQVYRMPLFLRYGDFKVFVVTASRLNPWIVSDDWSPIQVLTVSQVDNFSVLMGNGVLPGCSWCWWWLSCLGVVVMCWLSNLSCVGVVVVVVMVFIFEFGVTPMGLASMSVSGLNLHQGVVSGLRQWWQQKAPNLGKPHICEEKPNSPPKNYVQVLARSNAPCITCSAICTGTYISVLFVKIWQIKC